MDALTELELSGPRWCVRFPGDATTASLEQPFRRNLQAFIGALEASRGIHVSITQTYRPPQRAYLMVGAWSIWKHLAEPQEIPPMEGVGIQWVHPTKEASWTAARDMVAAYGLVHQPVLESEHTKRRAVDMNVRWSGVVEVVGRRWKRWTLDSSRTEHCEDNPVLHEMGASYDVYKLKSDRPHWSSTGH